MHTIYTKPPVSDVVHACATTKKVGKKIVLATGVFDLLHIEHENFLRKAKEAGDILVVAIESDARARELKGDGRPIESQSVRLEHVKSLPYVDFAFVLPDDFRTPERYEELLAVLQPDLYACSSHSPHQDKKQAMMEKYGGKLVVVHDHNPEVSTTQILKQKYP